MCGALPSEEEWKINTGGSATLQPYRNVRVARRFSNGEEATTMDRKTHEREPKKDRPRTERPPVTARRPKGGEGHEPSDTERATQRGDRDFDPNVNQRPR
jgi:hypothetical protein